MANPKSKFSKVQEIQGNLAQICCGREEWVRRGDEKKDNFIEGIQFSETQLIKFSYYFYKGIFKYLTYILL